MGGNRWPPRHRHGDPDPEETWPPPVEWQGAIGDISQALKALVPTAVLGEATYILDSLGQAADQYRVPFRALAVTSFSAAQLVIAAQPRQSAAPRSGPGVALLAPGASRTCHMYGYEWSIYGGSPGEAVVVEAFTRPVPPEASSQGNGITVSNVPGGSLSVTPVPEVITAPGTAAFAAAGNGTATLAVGVPARGFLVTWGNVASANNVTITVTNTATGFTITYVAALAVGQNSAFQVQFPEAINPAGGQGVSVTVTGNANSPSGNIAVLAAVL